MSGCDSRFNLAAWQRDLSIFSNDLSIGTEQDSDIVNEMLVTFDESGNEMQVVLFGKAAEVIGRWARDRSAISAKSLPCCNT